jgi:hypothetical protein
MKYLHLVNAHQQELNDFPIMWAFNDEQFVEGMQKLGLKETDTDKVYSIGSGGFMRKRDAGAFNEMITRHNREMKEAFSDDEFAYDAFLYELGNHEFCITYEYEPTLDALGLTEDDLLADNCRLLAILKKAKDDYMAGVEY